MFVKIVLEGSNGQVTAEGFEAEATAAEALTAWAAAGLMNYPDLHTKTLAEGPYHVADVPRATEDL